MTLATPLWMLWIAACAMPGSKIRGNLAGPVNFAKARRTGALNRTSSFRGARASLADIGAAAYCGSVVPQNSGVPCPPCRLYLLPILLLIGSNVFMTIAWYGHLRFKEVPLAGVIVVSWLIAFVEYCLAVPANRWGSAVYTTAQLKTIQEVITLLVFAAFSILYLKEPMTWNYAVGFVLIAAGAFFVFRGPL